MSLGFRHSEASKQKMSAATMGNQRGLGYRHTPESRAKISAAMIGNQRTLGCKHSLKSRTKRSESCFGENNPNWGGGKTVTHGYVSILCPNHPHAQCGGYVFEHRLVMEAALGRVLLPAEVVHHIDEIKDDNRKENLALCQNEESHRAIHSGELYLPC